MKNLFYTSPKYLQNLKGINSSASEIDWAVSKKQIVLPKALISNGEDIIKFNNISNWVISTGDETKFTVVNESFFGGDSYVELLETELGGNSSFRVVKDIDLASNDFISIYIWCSTYSSFGNVTIEFAPHETSYTNKLGISLKNLMKVKPNEWNNIRIPISNLTATGTISRKDLMKSFKITIFGTTGQLANIKIGGLKLNVEPRTSITFTFDDANQSDYLTAYPILKQYGFSGTSYIISQEIGTTVGTNPVLPRLTLSQMQEMFNNGWGFGIHGANYYNWVTESTLTQAETSIKACRDYLIDNGLKGFALKTTAYPHGEYNSDVIAILNKYGIKYARTTNLFNQQSPVENLMTLNLGLALKPTLQENIDALELLISRGGLINIYGHDMYESNPVKCTPTIFAQFVDYIDSKYRRYVTTLPQWCKDYETGAYI